MKKIFFLALLTVLVLSCAAAQQTTRQTAAADITLAFTRQGGTASNQFVVWIEDAQGNYIKTLYATRWAATGGWKKRPAAIPVWVSKSSLSDMTKNQIDAFSGATPRTGTCTYTWDGTDSRGAAVPDGEYAVVLEGNLRWENRVMCRAPILLGQGPATPNVSIAYTGDNAAERAMIADVKVQVLR